MRQPITQFEKERFEPMAKVLAANGIAQSLSYITERKYLGGIAEHTSPMKLQLATKSMDIPRAPFWIKISQVGKPMDNSAEKCFTAIQKILTACFIPCKAQLIFLVNGNKGKYDMYLGIRSFSPESIDDTFAENINNFIKGIWPGMKCSRVKGNVDDIRDCIKNRYHRIDAITGIPSMESQYKTVYPATIDTLMAGMQKKDFAYMVIADPIPEKEIDAMLYQLREFNGQAESLKSFNFSESTSQSTSVAMSESKAITDSINESKSEKSKWGLVGAGLMLATCLFPPAGAITTALAVADGANRIMGSNLLGDFTPTYTKGTSHSETTTKGRTDTLSQSQSQSLSHNIVNKQIEAVSEHLFYHSKRMENGKAIGCWSVGVYLMAENKFDIQGAALQLKSIVSGQESIFEPIRINHIEDVIDDKFIPFTLGGFKAPIIRINAPNGSNFEHPLGKHFNDLRTVLTTKELSYYINFPLHTVPGISVVDSVPEFSLNEQSDINEPVLEFGKMLFGGSTTNINYSIPISALSKHTLLSGINGTGKTNTVQAVLNAISNSGRKIPFLVIEPAKTEYVDWAIEHNKTNPKQPIKIFIPGCSAYRDRKTGKTVRTEQLKLNPFEPVWLADNQDPNILTHIDRLKSTFAAAFPMYDILPVLLEDLIYSLYQSPSTNWIGRDASPKRGKIYPPTLEGMAKSVDKAIEAHGYERRVADNMKACLNTRIASLRRGWKRDMLDTLRSTPFDQLFDSPCVINLSYVGDDTDKSFFMSLILQFLYEYRAAQAETGLIDFNSNSCRHLTVIEEAHRVMQKCDKPDEPQYKTAMMFSNMLSEIRAYGEGLFLVDQVPTRLIPDAIKNTNTKITHRLVAEDDCKAIAESMGISKEQRPIIPKLLVGQCLISTALSADKHWIKVNKMK